MLRNYGHQSNRYKYGKIGLTFRLVTDCEFAQKNLAFHRLNGSFANFGVPANFSLKRGAEPHIKNLSMPNNSVMTVMTVYAFPYTRWGLGVKNLSRVQKGAQT